MHPLCVLGLGLFGVAFVVLGGISVALLVAAWRKHRRYKLVSGTQTTDVRALRPGLAKTAGVAVGLGEPVVSPMTRTLCVYFDFKVEEQRMQLVQRGRGGPQTEWVVIVHDRHSAGFAVEDGDAQAELDLDGAEVTMKAKGRTANGSAGRLSPELDRMLRRRYDTSSNKPVRYSETIIAEGDELVVLGEVKAQKRKGRHVVGKGNGVPLLVSDQGSEELGGGLARSRTMYVLGSFVPLFLLFLVAIPSGLFFAIGLMDGQKEKDRLAARANPDPADVKPQEQQDFVARALADATGNAMATRRNGLTRLSKPPEAEKDRQEYEAARADPARRKEVAARLVEVIERMPVGKSEATPALEAWVTPDVVPDVCKMMARANSIDKRHLVRVLGASKDVRAVAVLAEQLNGKTPQPHVVSALEEIGSAGTGELVAALGKERADRRVLCQVLGKVGTREALPALRELEKSSNRPVADAAREAAKEIEGRKE